MNFRELYERYEAKFMLILDRPVLVGNSFEIHENFSVYKQYEEIIENMHPGKVLKAIRANLYFGEVPQDFLEKVEGAYVAYLLSLGDTVRFLERRHGKVVLAGSAARDLWRLKYGKKPYGSRDLDFVSLNETGAVYWLRVNGFETRIDVLAPWTEEKPEVNYIAGIPVADLNHLKEALKIAMKKGYSFDDEFLKI